MMKKREPVSCGGIVFFDEVTIHEHLCEGGFTGTTSAHHNHLVFGKIGLLLGHFVCVCANPGSKI